MEYILPPLPEAQEDSGRDFRVWTLSLGWDETKQRHVRATALQNKTPQGVDLAAREAAENEEDTEAENAMEHFD